MLSFAGCRLRDLAGLPNLPNLIRLDLSENETPVSELKRIKMYRELRVLSLCFNSQIKDTQDLAFLTGTKLEYLEIDGCPLAKVPGVRESLFALLPSLMILDQINRQGQPILESDSGNQSSLGAAYSLIDHR
jgi:hypothetical protein